MLIFGIVITLSSMMAAFWPDRRASAVEERIAKGDDRFFEEQRTYQAYPSMRDPKRIRIVGIIGTVFGLIFCALQLYRG